MAERSMWRLHWPALLLVIALGLLFIGAWLLDDTTQLGKTVALLAVVVSTAIAVAQYLYTRVDYWRLFVNRLRLKVLNPESQVSISIEYDVDSGTQSMRQVATILDEGADSKRLSVAPQSEVWIWHGNTVHVRATSRDDPIDGSQNMLKVDLPASRRSFRGMDRALRDELGPLLARIERDIVAKERKYVVTVEFLGGNPYFGLLVSKVNRDMVHRFDIDLLEATPAQSRSDVIRVKDNNVQVITETAHATQRLALRYLSLQPVHGGS